MQAIVDDEDGAPTASSTAGLPGADGADADVDTGERHELVCPFHFFFIQDSEDEDGHPVGKTASDLLPCGPISTVEDFWAYYSHILKPSDLPANFDVCFFKDGCRPLCDDPANTGGGRWTARLKKGQTARVWEDLLLAMVAGAWNVHLLLQGAVISVRAEDDVLAIWSEHADRGATLQLRQVLLKILNPPKNVIFEYKRHGTYKPPQPAGLKYSIGEMQQMKTACKDAPIYLWESLDAFHELRAGGTRDRKEGERAADGEGAEGGGGGGGGEGRGGRKKKEQQEKASPAEDGGAKKNEED